MKITEFIQNNTVVLDGGMGTLLQQQGLCPGELPERWNLTHPDTVTAIHKAYFDAGANVVNANTFGANLLKFSDAELDRIVRAAIANARRAAEQSRSEQPKWVALDVGPTGKLLRPLGELDFEEAVALFSHVARLGERYGADLIFIETMNDCYETKAALLAAKESTSLPVFVGNAYGEDGKLMTGATPAAMVAMLEGLGADAVGVNCSLGPNKLRDVVADYVRLSSLPVLVKPNAGIPRSENGRTVFDITPEEFAAELAGMVRQGVRAVGGCCGTDPSYIAGVRKAIADIPPVRIEKKNICAVSSYTHAVTLGGVPRLIGERINPTGKPKLKAALREENIGYILDEGIAEDELGADILDVNVGLPDIDEKQMLAQVVRDLQAVTARPLQIDTADPAAMEAALRLYNGKPMINSVNGKAESLRAVLPLAKKYGGVVVALTLDEQGIPDRAEDRLAIAERILCEAERYGIDKKDIVFDPLALSVSADPNAARQTLRAVRLITEKLGAHTSLGVSNISFGLPARDTINSAFFTLALGAGLSAAIMNPKSEPMMQAYRSYLALSGMDERFEGYIAMASALDSQKKEQPSLPHAAKAESKEPSESDTEPTSPLRRAIVKGLTKAASDATAELLKTQTPMALITEAIIPALDLVGEGFAKNTVFLPSLLMSAEAASAAFAVIRDSSVAVCADKGVIVLATVEGDIHDIGKNIVKLLLQNYGYEVCDLGKDVSAEEIAREAEKRQAFLVGLSALMTTTVPAMERTVALLHERLPACRVMVGGAVLTAEYAAQIGADHYAKDAMEAVRIAEQVRMEKHT